MRWTYWVLVNTDHVKLTVKNNTKTLLVASKDTGLKKISKYLCFMVTVQNKTTTQR